MKVEPSWKDKSSLIGGLNGDEELVLVEEGRPGLNWCAREEDFDSEIEGLDGLLLLLLLLLLVTSLNGLRIDDAIRPPRTRDITNQNEQRRERKTDSKING